MIPLLAIKDAIVIVGQGVDRVTLYTDLPSPTPGVSTDRLAVRFEVVANGGEAYVKQHFNIDAEVILVPRHVSNFSKR